MAARNEKRNNLIIKDVKDAIEENRTPLVLTRLIEHALLLYEQLADAADHVVLLYGDNTQKENRTMLSKLDAVDPSESVILIGTGSLIGEGFDYPRIDSVFFALPVSEKKSVLQYVGRSDRRVTGKKEVWIYDYIDPGVKKLVGTFSKRLKIYKENGWLVEDRKKGKKIEQSVNSSDTWRKVFYKDVEAAQKSILIVSEELYPDAVNRLINLFLPLKMLRVTMTIVTQDPGSLLVGDGSVLQECIEQLRNVEAKVYVIDDNLTDCAVIDEDLSGMVMHPFWVKIV